MSNLTSERLPEGLGRVMVEIKHYGMNQEIFTTVEIAEYLPDGKGDTFTHNTWRTDAGEWYGSVQVVNWQPLPTALPAPLVGEVAAAELDELKRKLAMVDMPMADVLAANSAICQERDQMRRQLNAAAVVQWLPVAERTSRDTCEWLHVRLPDGSVESALFIDDEEPGEWCQWNETSYEAMKVQPTHFMPKPNGALPAARSLSPGVLPADYSDPAVQHKLDMEAVRRLQLRGFISSGRRDEICRRIIRKQGPATPTKEDTDARP